MLSRCEKKFDDPPASVRGSTWRPPCALSASLKRFQVDKLGRVARLGYGQFQGYGTCRESSGGFGEHQKKNAIFCWLNVDIVMFAVVHL